MTAFFVLVEIPSSERMVPILTIAMNFGHKHRRRNRPVARGEGESFPGPRDVWGPRRRSKILKMVFQMASF